MKRLATLFILTILATTAGFAKSKHKDLSGISPSKDGIDKRVPANLPRYPGHYPPGCQNDNPGENSDNIYYAVEVNGSTRDHSFG